MHILIAPNAFKNSLNAEAVAEAIAKGLSNCQLQCSYECFPVADGGDGTANLIIKKFGGNTIIAQVSDPLGRKINASFGLIDEGNTAVIEMANASGLRLLKPNELNPLKALSLGTGELIRLALDRGVKKIIIGMGGSATVDGGVGILKALGFEFLDKRSETLSGLPQSLVDLERIEISGVDQRIFDCEVIILCDVDNQLLGKNGAANIFGPQKGADEEGVEMLEASLKRLSDVILNQNGKDISIVKRGGTAGGAAAGLFGLINAKLLNGIDYFLELRGFQDALAKADLLITAEGSIDEQTLQGKGPIGVARLAKIKGLPVIGLAGRIPLEHHPQLLQYFDVLLPIANEPSNLIAAMNHTAQNLSRTATALGNILAISKKKDLNSP